MKAIESSRKKTDRPKDFAEYTIKFHNTIREAFKKHDINKESFILVLDEDEKVIGIVTSGDFHKTIWDARSLEDPVEDIMNRDFVYLSENEGHSRAEEIFSTSNIRQIPVLDEQNGRLVDIIFKGKTKTEQEKTKLNLPVVIMAGGLGTRLDPVTLILPKPLIPIGEKPVIELIVERFLKFGIKEFIFSINHKARMIKAFFDEVERNYNISYIEESKPLGTAGALKYLEGKITSPFIVSNCDIIIEGDYREIYEFHKNGGYMLTLVASMKNHVVPYGVCTTSGEGELESLTEKPKYDFLINTGMYIIEPQALEYIPDKKRFDMTDLIALLKEKNIPIGVYPISEKSWIDIGQWEDYRNSIKKLDLYG